MQPYQISEEDGEVIMDWLSTKKLRTGRYYMTDIELLLRTTGKPLREIVRADVEAFMELPVAEVTGRRRLGAIKSLFHYAAASGYLPYNVTSEIAHKVKERRRVAIDILTKSEVRELLRQTKDDRGWCMIALSYYCAMTAAEIAKLGWDALMDNDNHSMAVTIAGEFARRVKVPTSVAKRLESFRPKTVGALVFRSRSGGGSLTSDSVRRTVRQIGETVGLIEVTPQRLRTTRAYHLIAHGAGPIEVRQLLGLSHRTVGALFQLYEKAHSAPSSVSRRRHERFARANPEMG